MKFGEEMTITTRLLFFLSITGLIGLFSGTGSVSAQQTAGQVDPTNQEEVRNFVLDAKEFIENNPPWVTLPEMAKEGGRWKSGSMYLILMDGTVGEVHAGYPDAGDMDLASSVPQVGEILEGLKPGQADDQGVFCISYTDPDGVEGRYACAASVSRTVPGGEILRVLVGGLHHEPLPEKTFEELLGSNYEPDIKAMDVTDSETLKLFVNGALEAIQANFGVSRVEAPVVTRFRPVLRKEGGYWNHRDIYLFIMQGNQVIFNGNDQALEGTTLNITDLNNCNVAEEILRVAGSDNDSEARECPSLGLLPEGDSENFIEYLWDNPDIEGDEDKRFDNPAFEQKITPGITPKLGYIVSFQTPLGDDVIHIGAGVYPQSVTAEEDSDDGCAIAGSGNVPNSKKHSVFNLFLIGLALFTVVSWINRPKSKRQ